eukprot:CAMPEP_0117443656 /NCGR_PEP_ID=MMETSP0759-20121206/4812_1 /TAXON_ID=63605 /ORGANISM="Percolomonas cosmopolitus, Strain WS" /LENGTH=484 /DNA_ID=CAMNT_0005235647 /DNA_START=289 /DNA_END=1743 /DNA_ORIENTATION=+
MSNRSNGGVRRTEQSLRNDSLTNSISTREHATDLPPQSSQQVASTESKTRPNPMCIDQIVDHEDAQFMETPVEASHLPKSDTDLQIARHQHLEDCPPPGNSPMSNGGALGSVGITPATEPSLSESEQETTTSSGIEDEDEDDEESIAESNRADDDEPAGKNTDKSSDIPSGTSQMGNASDDSPSTSTAMKKGNSSVASTSTTPPPPLPTRKAPIKAPHRKFVNPYTQLSDDEGLLVAHITQFIHNRHNREIDRQRLQRKIERTEYDRIIEEVHNYLSENRQVIARDFSTKYSSEDEWRRKVLLTLADYALQEFIFSQNISSMCMASIRTKISFLEDYKLIEQCDILRSKPMSFFDIPSTMADNPAITFSKAIEELNLIESHSTPAQALRCILNTVHAVFDELRVEWGDQHVSADDLLPILIYVICNATNLQNPLMIVEYAQSLSHQEGEAAYYLVLFESALQAVKQNLLLRSTANATVSSPTSP